MKKNNNLLFTILLLILSINIVQAECTEEEKKQITESINKVELIYKHLGEVTKEDGSKVYNEYMVTATNIPEGVYVHLYPFTDENFEETDEGLKLKLTTGEWHYYMYSEKCNEVLKDIELNLPKFNTYSLDPLCKDVDTEEFIYCHKYYQNDMSRETFERKVKEYRKINHLDDKDINNKNNKTNIIKSIINFLLKYYIYIIIFIGVIVLIVPIILIRKKRKRTILK